jgi:hypothetical protein
MDSVSSVKLLKDLRAAFLSLPPSVPLISDNDTIDGITNTSSDVDTEYVNFNNSLRKIFGDPETGITFPERGQRLNDIVEDFDVMMDTIARGPHSTRHLMDEVSSWVAALVLAAKDLINKHKSGASTRSQPIHNETTTPNSCPIPAKEKPLPTASIAPRRQHPSMNRMRIGTLPFTKIGAEETANQSRRESDNFRKDAVERSRKERQAKERRLDEKRASAVRRQRECRERKKSKEIRSGLRNSSGRKLKKTVNSTVCLSSHIVKQLLTDI